MPSDIQTGSESVDVLKKLLWKPYTHSVIQCGASITALKYSCPSENEF